MELHHNMYPDADPFTDVRPNTEKIGCFLDGKGLLLFLLHRRATHALPTLVERNLPRFNETHGWAVQATRKRTATIRCSYCYNILIHRGTHGTWGSKFTPPRDFLQTLVIVSLTFCLRQVSKYHMKTISPLFYSAVSVDLNPGNWLMEAFRPSSSEQAAHVVVQDLDSCSSGGATVSSDFYS